MATNTSDVLPLYTLAAREGKQWRALLEGATRRACETMREALGLPSTRIHRRVCVDFIERATPRK